VLGLGRSFLIVDSLQLDLKDQGRVGRNEAGEATITISIISSDCEDGLLAQRHLRDTLIPASNDLAHADLCLEISTSFRGIEFVATVQFGIFVVEPASVLDRDFVALLWKVFAIARLVVFRGFLGDAHSDKGSGG